MSAAATQEAFPPTEAIQAPVMSGGGGQGSAEGVAGPPSQWQPGASARAMIQGAETRSASGQGSGGGAVGLPDQRQAGAQGSAIPWCQTASVVSGDIRTRLESRRQGPAMPP